MFRINQSLASMLSSIEHAPTALSNQSILDWSEGGQINQNVIDHLSSYFRKETAESGPYEIHPFIYREAAQFDLSRRYLLLGTFPPATYIRNIPQLSGVAAADPDVRPAPSVDFYFGETTSLWHMFGLPSVQLTRAMIDDFLKDRSIAVTDVILGAQRMMFHDIRDMSLFNILPNHQLCKLFSDNSAIETILFTSGNLAGVPLTTSGHISLNMPNTVRVFLKTLIEICTHEQLYVSGKPDGSGTFYRFGPKGLAHAVSDQDNHLIWYLRFGDKVLRMVSLPSPATPATLPETPFFRRWLQYKAKKAGIQSPAKKDDLLEYMTAYPDVFVHPYMTQYRSEIYQMAIDHPEELFTI